MHIITILCSKCIRQAITIHIASQFASIYSQRQETEKVYTWTNIVAKYTKDYFVKHISHLSKGLCYISRSYACLSSVYGLF